MNIFAMISIIFVVFMALMIFVTPFRTFVIGELSAIALLIGHYVPDWLRSAARAVGIYTFILAAVTLLGFLLMFIAILIGNPGLTGFLFLFSLSLILLAWLPAGVILRTFRVTAAVVPQSLKVAIAYLAFVGFLGLVAPSVFTFSTVVGAGLVALILMGAAAHFNLLDKIIIPLVLIMCLVLAWQNFFPESYRSSVRYASSWSKRFDTFKDRASISNETDAATTYGVLLKDINVLYRQNAKGRLYDNEVTLQRGTTVLICDFKKELFIIEGQSFIEIQLAKENGEFVNGPKYLIQSAYLQTASPRDIIPEDDSLLPGRKEDTTPSSGRMSVSSLTLGSNVFHLPNIGDETPFLSFPDGIKVSYKISSSDYGHKIIYSDGREYDGGPNGDLPSTRHALIKIRATKPNQFVTITLNRV